MRAVAGLLAGFVALTPATARAADDVDLIPQDVLDTKPAPPPGTAPAGADAMHPAGILGTGSSPIRSKVFVEDAFSGWSPAAAVPVPYPSSQETRWQNRTSLDASLQWKAEPWLTLTLSDRLNVFEQDGQSVVTANTVRNDLREALVTWQPTRDLFLEAGRINVRDGAALGFNPTDVFKTRTLVGQASLDPSVIRENRLGALMVRAQTLWSWGSATVAFAPKVADPSPITESHPVGVDPRFDATNAANRVLTTLNFEVLDLSPQLLAYFELHRSKLGANLTRTLGDSVVAYAEWAGGPEQNLIARASAFGHETGTLPRGAPVVPPTSPDDSFRNDVAAGFSWTVAAAVTFNAEYHFHEGGFTRDDWRRWFNLGSVPGAPYALTGALWFMRSYANDQQEPVTQHQMFVRASWPRAFTPDLELSAFSFVSLLDGSVLAQLSASYYLSDAWTASAYVSGDFGEGRSERGSFPQRANGILQLTKYL